MSANFALKTILFILGWFSIILALIGAVLPIMPTAPFLILAAYFFSKSSPRVHSWLTRLPYFGDVIIDWEKNRVIKPAAKGMSVFIIVLIFTSSIILTTIHIGLKIMLVCIGLGCIGFILSRKSRPE